MPKRTTEDYYALLGIEAGAADDEVRRAWRKLALEHHPDRAGVEATAVFQQISVAYSVLSDPDARAAYDRVRGVVRKPPPPPPEDVPFRRAPSVMLRRVCAPLNALLARGVAEYAEPGVIELFLEPDEVAEGGMITISMRVMVKCPACATAANPACPQCGGTRAVDDLYAAWLAVRPGTVDGTMLTPSARLPGMIQPVTFRVRTR